MSRNLRVFVAGLCLMAIAYKTQAAKPSLLQCWHCGSDTVGAADFCGVTFKEDNIPTDQITLRNISILRPCNSSINSEQKRPVCRKTVEEIDGKTVTRRYCYYTSKSDTMNSCQQQSSDTNVKRIFCEDCLKDGCNSAPDLTATVNVLAGIIFSLPLTIARFLQA